MDASTIIERLGGVTAVARMFAIKPSSVSEWKQDGKGIPKARMQYIALARPDVFRNDHGTTPTGGSDA